MKKQKLTLKELAGYLPNETKVLRLCNNEVLLLHGISGKNTIEATKTVLGIEYSALLAFGDTDISDDEEFKLLLRPLSGLTKEITRNGETFVPIVELAKIGTKENNCYVTNGNYGTCYIDSELKKGFFIYSQNTFMWQIGKNADSRIVYNQLELFEKLYEWHFDIHGLIESGLAINLNDLSND